MGATTTGATVGIGTTRAIRRAFAWRIGVCIANFLFVGTTDRLLVRNGRQSSIQWYDALRIAILSITVVVFMITSETWGYFVHDDNLLVSIPLLIIAKG
jgi:TRAP-type uncharacterized transport system fused permease subunit